MTKHTLLAAASLATMLVAGAASAGTITGSVSTVPTTAASTFTIASERTDASTATAAGGFVVTNNLTNALTITANTTQNYRVTFTVTNGTIASSTLEALNAGAATVGATVAAAGTTANSATFIVTVNAGGANSVITDFRLTTTLTSPSEQAVSVASTTELLAGGVASTVDTTAATQLVRYAAAVGPFTATSNNTKAALPDFRTFTNSGITTNPAPLSNTNRTAELASNFGIASTTTGNAGSVFYATLSSANAATAPVTVSRDDIVAGGTVTIAGGQLNALVPALVGVTGATATRTAGSAVFVLDNAQGDQFIAGSADFTLTNPAAPNDVVINAGSFSTAFAPTFAAGYTAPTSALTAASGNITLDGVNFIAPWVSGSQSPNQTVIRLSNSSGAVSGAVTLRLRNAQARAAGVTTGPGSPIADQTCSTTFTVPATGDLQLGGGELSTCFGAFLRGDLLITVQSASSTLTAKARLTGPNGALSEISLGRYSGATAADAAF